MGSLARWIVVLVLVLASLRGLWAQSVVFVSPSTKGLLSMECAAGSLDSFEERQYLAAAHYLTEHLCPQARIAAVAGLWKGQAENSGMIDGCADDRAREVGALLGRYYRQKAALVFARSSWGKAALVHFQVAATLPVLARRMTADKVSGASVLPAAHGQIVMMVVTNAAERTRARRLYATVHGQRWQEEPGTAELIGDDDRGKAREVYDRLIGGSPAEVQELAKEMYSEKFAELGSDER